MLVAPVPDSVIPKLSGQVTPEMLRVLKQIQKTEPISIDLETVRILQALVNLDLVLANNESPVRWYTSANGTRVLRYLTTSIHVGPHYEIASSELAAWLVQQGEDQWWNIDGDPLLTGRMTFPCPVDELAVELRMIDRPLLVPANKDDLTAIGQRIPKDKLNELVAYFSDIFHPNGSQGLVPQNRDRFLYLCWKGAFAEWFLVEDSETAELMWAEEKALTGKTSNRK